MSEWVNILNSQPEHLDRVIISGFSPISCRKYVGEAVYQGILENVEGGLYRFWDFARDFRPLDVTHWMPLPELPTGDN